MFPLLRLSSFSAFTYESDDEDDSIINEEEEISCLLLLGLGSCCDDDDDANIGSSKCQEQSKNKSDDDQHNYLCMDESTALVPRSENQSRPQSSSSQKMHRTRNRCKRNTNASPLRKTRSTIMVVFTAVAMMLLVFGCQAFLWFFWRPEDTASAASVLVLVSHKDNNFYYDDYRNILL